MIKAILASNAALVAYAAATTPVQNDIVAVIGALLATVIVVLEARKRDRTLANSISLFIGSSLLGSLTPGVLLYNARPDLAERFTWHVWILLGFVAGLVGWVLVGGVWNFVKKRNGDLIAAAARRWAILPPEAPFRQPPDAEDDVPMK